MVMANLHYFTFFHAILLQDTSKCSLLHAEPLEPFDDRSARNDVDDEEEIMDQTKRKKTSRRLKEGRRIFHLPAGMARQHTRGERASMNQNGRSKRSN